MANKAKFFNARNKYKLLKENKLRRLESIARRRSSEEAKKAAV